MKKFAIAIMLLAALLLSACGGKSGEVQIPNVIRYETDEKLIDSGTNYMVTEVRSKNVTKYSYTVTDPDGNIIESALCAEKPEVSCKDDLVGIRFSDDGHYFCRYYNIQTKEVSKSFKNAFWDNGKQVAYYSYSNGHIFVVQDIFGDGYYTEVPVESSSWQISVSSAAANGNTLSVDYYESGDKVNAASGHVNLPLPAESPTPAE